MAKFSGPIGYSGGEVETKPGVWEDVVVERIAYGDVLSNSRGLEGGEKVNSDITVTNRISIVADEYAYNHIYAMKYLLWRGNRWVINNVEVQHPRLILSLGGLYVGETPPTP